MEAVERVVDTIRHVHRWLEGGRVVWVGRHTSYERGLGVFVVVDAYFVGIRRISMCWLVRAIERVVDTIERVHCQWRGGRHHMMSSRRGRRQVE